MAQGLSVLVVRPVGLLSVCAVCSILKMVPQQEQQSSTVDGDEGAAAAESGR